MNTENLNTMCDWERQKVIFLMGEAEKLRIKTSSYGEIAVNPNSGYTYLWVEDYNFALYMPINCELNKSDIWVIWNNPENGEEIEMQLEDNTSLSDLEDWAEKLSVETEEG